MCKNLPIAPPVGGLIHPIYKGLKKHLRKILQLALFNILVFPSSDREKSRVLRNSGAFKLYFKAE